MRFCHFKSTYHTHTCSQTVRQIRRSKGEADFLPDCSLVQSICTSKSELCKPRPTAQPIACAQGVHVLQTNCSRHEVSVLASKHETQLNPQRCRNKGLLPGIPEDSPTTSFCNTFSFATSTDILTLQKRGTGDPETGDELGVTQYTQKLEEGQLGLLGHHAPCPHSPQHRTPRKPHSGPATSCC